MMEAAQGPADGEAYVRRCLTMEYAETAENRTFASDPAFADVLTALNTQRYAVAIASGQELLPRFADFDLPYKWVASAYRATQQWPSARSVLLTGLTRSRRKSLLLTDLGETDWQSGNLASAVYWWSQAVHCLARNPVDATAFLLLGSVAGGLGLTATEAVFLDRADSLRAGRVRLDPATAGRLAALARANDTEPVRRVLDGLRFGYLAPPQAAPPPAGPTVRPVAATAQPPAPQPALEPRTRKHGKGVMIGAVAGLAVIAVALGIAMSSRDQGGTASSAPVLTATPSPSDSPSHEASGEAPRVTAVPAQTAAVYGAHVGTCWNPAFDMVDCSAEHQFEVYGIGALTGTSRPSNSELEAVAAQFCAAALPGYVGKPEAKAPQNAQFWTPDVEGWESGDRSIVCLVESNPMVKGSLKDR